MGKLHIAVFPQQISVFPRFEDQDKDIHGVISFSRHRETRWFGIVLLISLFPRFEVLSDGSPCGGISCRGSGHRQSISERSFKYG
jgi:hypothetical protein